ncbi:uncharacterized protein PG998_008316 [Apiospora kogelbergensis]|uniref:uncharacterized protein n=1 Tax=Apiospora kogelbergensis TaxID=1337665 RepID=UPI00312E4A2D
MVLSSKPSSSREGGMAEGFLSPPATTAMHSDGGPRHPVAASTSNDEKTPSPLRSGRASRLNPKGNRRGDRPDHSSGSREGDEENRGSSHDVSPYHSRSGGRFTCSAA